MEHVLAAARRHHSTGSHDFFNSGTWLVDPEPRDLLRRRLLARGRLLGLQGRAPPDRGSVAGRDGDAARARSRRSSARFIYMLFRPPEYLEDVRERELEIKAMEERLAAARPRTARSAARRSTRVPRLPGLHDEAEAGVRHLQGAARAALAGVPVLRDAGRARRLDGRCALDRGVTSRRSSAAAAPPRAPPTAATE